MRDDRLRAARFQPPALERGASADPDQAHATKTTRELIVIAMLTRGMLGTPRRAPDRVIALRDFAK